MPTIVEWERQQKYTSNSEVIMVKNDKSDLHTGAALVERTGSRNSRSYTHAENALNITREGAGLKSIGNKSVHVTNWDLPQSNKAPRMKYSPTALEKYLLENSAQSRTKDVET
ncbi:MAG: hypothetical protein EoVTN8_310 [Fluviibacter phosphoraccumulans EoVTN8]